MFKLNPESDAAKLFEKFVFKVVSKRIENTLANEKIQERVDIDEVTVENKQKNTIENSV